LPTAPAGLTITPTGPDPTLSLPQNLVATPGQTVVVPVNLDNPRPEASTGLMEAVLALRYDPAVFAVSAADVHLGSLPMSGSGWHLQAVVNATTGEIGIDLFSNTPIANSTGGSLVTLTLHALDDAPAGASGINLVRAVNPTGQRQFVTTASDAAGPYILHPAVTDGGDNGVDGMVSVQAASTMFIQTSSAASQEFNDPTTVAKTATPLLPAVAENLTPRQELAFDQIFADLEWARIVSANPEGISLDSLGDSAFEGAPTLTQDTALVSPTVNESPWDAAAEGYFAKLGLVENRARKALKNGMAYGFEPIGDSFDVES
ncbi:MAG TPA: cohesin domain-containing protein, partial [Gemmataceae bacterium]|nr:cohesin domain-containing protein [Gemmataceae bacterium]